jgi:hypothetical protein
MLLTNVVTEMQPAGAIPVDHPVDERYRSYDERYKASSVAINVGLGAKVLRATALCSVAPRLLQLQQNAHQYTAR